MGLKSIINFFIACSIILISFSAFGGWREINSEQGAFKVLMPGNPSFKQHKEHTPDGIICENTYNYKTKDMTLTTEYQDLPGLALIFGKGMVYNKSAKAFLKDVDGKKKSFNKFKLGDYEGKELVYVTSTRNGWVRFLLINKRLYVLQASFMKGVNGAPIAKKYFQSFKSSMKLPERRRTRKMQDKWG